MNYLLNVRFRSIGHQTPIQTLVQIYVLISPHPLQAAVGKPDTELSGILIDFLIISASQRPQLKII